ncbi:MAG: hypothetical protein Q9187_002991 [Circinaria calcarea]
MRRSLRATGYAIVASRHNRDDAVYEASEDSEPVDGLEPQTRGLEMRRKNRRILADPYPEENSSPAPGFIRTDSYSSTSSNVNWDPSTQSYISQGQYSPLEPSHCGYPSSRRGYSDQQQSDFYQGKHQPAGTPQNYASSHNQYSYGNGGHPGGHHQYSIQGSSYNEIPHGNNNQHQDHQQQYLNQGQPYHPSNQQQMFPGQAQGTIAQLYAQNEQDYYSGPDITYVRRVSTTPVPDTSNQCPHGTLSDSPVCVSSRSTVSLAIKSMSFYLSIDTIRQLKSLTTFKKAKK